MLGAPAGHSRLFSGTSLVSEVTWAPTRDAVGGKNRTEKSWGAPVIEYGEQERLRLGQEGHREP